MQDYSHRGSRVSLFIFLTLVASLRRNGSYKNVINASNEGISPATSSDRT